MSTKVEPAAGQQVMSREWSTSTFTEGMSAIRREVKEELFEQDDEELERRLLQLEECKILPAM